MKPGQLIFSEPPEDIDDSSTHGAMLGGMSGYDDETLAGSYFQAGTTLVDHVLTSGTRGQDLICPILYVYRHGIELYLKVILQPEVRNHSLGSLLDAFCHHVYSRYGERVPFWVTRPITQLAEFDPGSDLFRYGETHPPSISARFTNAGEFWVDLPTLKRTMLHLQYAFLRTLVADGKGLEALNRVFPRWR